jgi:hypothetical protein
MRIDCPNCHRLLKEPNKPRQESDSGFDATGFAVGMATGVPLSPTHGVSVGSMIGAAMHSEPARSEEAPAPSAPEPSYSAPELLGSGALTPLRTLRHRSIAAVADRPEGRIDDPSARSAPPGPRPGGCHPAL